MYGYNFDVYNIDFNPHIIERACFMQKLRICMNLVLMCIQLFLTPYANECFNVNTIGIPNLYTDL